MTTPPTPHTLRWIDDARSGWLELLDQTCLPGQIVYLRLDKLEPVCEAIGMLRVRGAPAIGVAAAYGFLIGLRERLFDHAAADQNQLAAAAEQVRNTLVQTRPTAVNLAWAANQMHALAAECIRQQASPEHILHALLEHAAQLHNDDVRSCLAIGQAGLHLIQPDSTILTHCNAGALATCGIGTATAPIYLANSHGLRPAVLCDETRPLLQGARLTAWELTQAGIPATILCDSMAAAAMALRKVHAVIVGADRIAANGDTANKIGTYALAIAAKHHNIPFYVAAPASTFDLACPAGHAIPIEQRMPAEVRGFGPTQWAAPLADTWNPAFDITPAELVCAFITDRGLIQPPYQTAIPAALGPVSTRQPPVPDA